MSEEPQLSELQALSASDPRRLGAFRIVGRLATGHMGEVYAGVDDSGRPAAVQAISPRIAVREDYRNRLRREADLLPRVEADCAAPFLAADPRAPVPWLAREFVPGRTLRAHVAHQGPLNEAAAQALALGVAEAIAAIHAAGLTHRDLTPDAVILSPLGPRVIGFGVARALDDTDPDQGAYGTPDYLAPERLEGMPASTAADVFAWAGLVVFAATGHGPFGDGEPSELRARVRRGLSVTYDVPGTLSDLVQRCLVDDPGMRPDARPCFTAMLDATAPAPRSVKDQERLRSVMRSAWHGFDAAAHRPESWAAALASAEPFPVDVHAQAAPSNGATAHRGAAAESSPYLSSAVSEAHEPESPAARRGNLKVLLVGAGLLTVAALAAFGLEHLGSDEGATSEASTGAEEETTGASPAAPTYAAQEVEFRDMVLQVPEDWGAYPQESTIESSAVMEPGEEGEWLVLVPEPEEGCDEDSAWRWEEPGSAAAGSTEALCPHILVLGPEVIAVGGGEAPAFDPQEGWYHVGIEFEPCPEGAAVIDAVPEPGAAQDTTVGDRSAVHHDAAVPCGDHANFVEGEGVPQAAYQQRTWYLDEEGVLIVDRWENEDFPEYLGLTEWR
jgi:serine/threonine protein kinase